MEKYLIRPWVGKNYLSGGVFGKKVLVLGESHYCFEVENGKCAGCCVENMKEDCHSQTEDVIEEFLNHYGGEPYQQTFLCFERALAGRELSEQERYELWNSIIFYNYFQLNTTGPREEPNKNAKKISEEAFRNLLEEFLPDAIIVWGARLFDKLPGWNGHSSALKVEDTTDIWHYNINGKDIPAMLVHHPSSPSGKSWPFWHKFHIEFIGEPVFDINK